MGGSLGYPLDTLLFSSELNLGQIQTYLHPSVQDLGENNHQIFLISEIWGEQKTSKSKFNSIIYNRDCFPYSTETNLNLIITAFECSN